MQKSWKEIKEQYWIGTLIFSIFVVLTYIAAPSYKLSDLTTKTVTLSSNPIWKETHYRGASYWVELNFIGESRKYEIAGIDYKYLRHSEFKDSVHRGDQVTINIKRHQILTFAKNGIEYLNFDKAQLHKVKNGMFARRLFLTGLVFCLIPLLFNTYPTLAINGKHIRIRFGWILVISLVIAFIILSKTIGSQYVSGDEFAK